MGTFKGPCASVLVTGTERVQPRVALTPPHGHTAPARSAEAGLAMGHTCNKGSQQPPGSLRGHCGLRGPCERS